MTDLRNIEAREPDGTGNNPLDDDLGSSNETFKRITLNSYADGFGEMLDVPPPPGPPAPVNTAANPDWIDPAAITDAVMAQPKDGNGNDISIPNSFDFNEYGQFFGQFLTHDVAEAEIGAPGAEQAFILPDLPFPFGRTPGDVDGDGVKQQHNHETSYLDMSNVYGRSEEMLDLLRADHPGGGQSAYLLMGDDNLLATYQDVADDSGVDINTVLATLVPDAAVPNSPDQFATGDDRGNQQPALNSHQTVWARNHNWHVDQLKANYAGWTEQEYFNAARALNEAEWQNVVYNEYLTKLTGQDILGGYTGYNSSVDPSVINEWTTVAFRFGHDQSSNLLTLVGEDGTLVGTETLASAFNLGNIAQAYSTGSIDDWLRGQLELHTQEIDGYVVEGNRQLLFGLGGTVNLEVFDIARGRDHGVGDYNELRQELGLDTYSDFDDFAAANNLAADRLAALKAIYNDDIGLLDSIVGVLLEKPAGAAMLGETGTLLNVLQFTAMSEGDRFFYLNRFDDDLIAQIDKTSMADILLRTTDIDYVYHDAFLAHNRIGGDDGNYGNNTLYGTDDEDLVLGFDGRDNLKGRDGNDDLYGGTGDDTANGGNDDDRVYGEDGNDDLYGASGDDIVEGGSGYDRVNGGGGDDVVKGGKGNDLLIGGKGDDWLAGGEGSDHMTGNGGKDRFLFKQGDTGTGPDKDYITDFNVKQDWIVLKFDAEFNYIGFGHGFSGGGGAELRLNGNTLQGDADGDGYTDLEIMLQGLKLSDVPKVEDRIVQGDAIMQGDLDALQDSGDGAYYDL